MKNNKGIDVLYSILPFFYTVRSRYDNFSNFLSWLISFPIFYIMIFNMMESTAPVINMLIYFLCINLVYEIGYIYNDKVTTKKEKSPTIRCSFLFTDENYELVIILKAVLAFSISVYFFEIRFTFGLFLLLLSFLLHNEVRSNYNILTYCLLFSIKTLLPVLFFVNNYFLICFLMLVVVFPRVIEHTSRNRYNIKSIQNLLIDRDLFRILYTMCSCVIMLLFSFYYSIENSLIVACSFLFLITYKFLAKFIKDRKILKIKKHPDYEYK